MKTLENKLSFALDTQFFTKNVKIPENLSMQDYVDYVLDEIKSIENKLPDVFLFQPDTKEKNFYVYFRLGKNEFGWNSFNKSLIPINFLKLHLTQENAVIDYFESPFYAILAPFVNELIFSTNSKKKELIARKLFFYFLNDLKINKEVLINVLFGTKSFVQIDEINLSIDEKVFLDKIFYHIKDIFDLGFIETFISEEENKVNEQKLSVLNKFLLTENCLSQAVDYFEQYPMLLDSEKNSKIHIRQLMIECHKITFENLIDTDKSIFLKNIENNYQNILNILKKKEDLKYVETFKLQENDIIKIVSVLTDNSRINLSTKNKTKYLLEEISNVLEGYFRAKKIPVYNSDFYLDVFNADFENFCKTALDLECEIRKNKIEGFFAETFEHYKIDEIKTEKFLTGSVYTGINQTLLTKNDSVENNATKSKILDIKTHLVDLKSQIKMIGCPKVEFVFYTDEKNEVCAKFKIKLHLLSGKSIADSLAKPTVETIINRIKTLGGKEVSESWPKFGYKKIFKMQNGTFVGISESVEGIVLTAEIDKTGEGYNYFVNQDNGIEFFNHLTNQ
jgi:hypothetical protein